MCKEANFIILALRSIIRLIGVSDKNSTSSTSFITIRKESCQVKWWAIRLERAQSRLAITLL